MQTSIRLCVLDRQVGLFTGRVLPACIRQEPFSSGLSSISYVKTSSSGTSKTRAMRNASSSEGAYFPFCNDSIFSAQQAGARGYILKDTDEDEMIRAIRAAGNGEAIFSPSIANQLMEYFSSSRTKILEEFFPELPVREREILELIAVGESNQEIADHLSIRLKTVRNHVSNIYNKLMVADSAQAVITAREAGLGKS